MSHDAFLEPAESEAMALFSRQGYVVFPLESAEGFNRLRNKIFDWCAPETRLRDPSTVAEYLNFFHHQRTTVDINTFRLQLIDRMAVDEEWRPLLYGLARHQIHWIVGNELAMQRTCNLSIQIPGDAGSVLPLHADVWSGNSPYEVVLWLPLVDCYRTKSMFLLPYPESVAIYDEFKRYSLLTTEELYRVVEDRLVWLDVPAGQGVIFWHGLLHGNRVNEEAETRWTLNVRFKSLLTPYGSKQLGESFLPITVRPATRFGAYYREPDL